MAKILVIGLDGATWDLIKPWAEQGHLPTLASLMREGAWGTLRSTIPPLSAPAWASFLTGKHPNKHGLWAFTMWGESYQRVLANGSHVRARTIGEILSEHGKRTIQVNVPMTYPPRSINGIWVSGMDTPGVDHPFTYPPEVAPELIRRFAYEIEPDLSYVVGGEEEFIAEVKSVESRRAEAGLYLLRHRPWDLFIIVFRGIDFLSHHFWRFVDSTHPAHDAHLAEKFGDVLLEHYKMMDEVVGRFITHLPEDVTLIIMSDHGFGPHHRWVYLDHLFLKMGLIRLKRDFPRRIKKALFDRGITVTRSVDWLRRLSLLGILRKTVPLSIRREMGSKLNPLKEVNIDWRRTAVYPVVGQGLVRLNVRGRDPEGCVEPGAEYERILERIIKEISQLRDPTTGRYVVRGVRRREEICPSDGIYEFPDLWIEWERGYLAKSEEGFTNELFSGWCCDLSGSHQINGIVLFYGRHVRGGTILRQAHIMDLAPTILHLLRLPIPGDMDGKVLLEALSEEVRERPVVYEQKPAPPPQQGHEFSPEEETMIERRLKDLGYL